MTREEMRESEKRERDEKNGQTIRRGRGRGRDKESSKADASLISVVAGFAFRNSTPVPVVGLRVGPNTRPFDAQRSPGGRGSWRIEGKAEADVPFSNEEK